VDYDYVKRRAEETAPWVIDIRRQLHMHPELGGQEENTQRFLLAKLNELNIETATYPGQHAVVGLIRGTFPGKTIALRADMDALPVHETTGLPFASQIPGRMHACGHDAHMAIALGAAKLLMENRDKIHGQVKLLFEPAEETTGGAQDMVAAGCLENPHVDAVFGLHMLPDQPAGVVFTKPGCVSGASNEINITISGIGCHGAYPERGVDAVAIAAQIITAMQTLVSRNVSPLDSAVVTIGKITGGTARNVICDRVEIEGTLRTLKPETRAMLKEKLKEISAAIAAAMGGSAKAAIPDGYGAVYNDEALHEQFLALAKIMVGEKNIVPRVYPSLGVESFSFFVANTPGVYYDLGCGVGSALHTCDFHVDESCLKVGVSLQAAMVLNYLKG
jgi:amidohydrolase